METLNTSKKPLQERTRERVERVLAAAEQLLLELGPERTSIPGVAQLSGVPRASIYQFFPNKYVLLMAISDRHLKQIAQRIEQLAAGQEAMNLDLDLESVAARATRVTADYYNANPVASMLILGGPMSREAYLSQEITIQDIGRQLQALAVRHWPGLALPGSPDVLTIAVEIAFACLKHAYFTQATISDEMVEHATIAAVAYLRRQTE